MADRKLFANLSKALVDGLIEHEFPACRSRLFRFDRGDFGTLFNDKPALIVSKGQVTSSYEARYKKEHLVGVNFTLISKDSSCGSCETDPLDDFDDYIECVRDCVCNLCPELCEPYEFVGQTGDVVEVDDPEQNRSAKQFVSQLTVTFRVFEILEDDE